MDSKEFVSALERYVRDAAVRSTITALESPPGRHVPTAVRDRSDWYNSLGDEDRARVREIAALAAHSALFGMLAVVDGSRVIDDIRGQFKLLYVADKEVLLNSDSISLHELLTGSEKGCAEAREME